MDKRTFYGGQAVIEGVMMQGRSQMVTAVRRPSGELAFNVRPLDTIYTSPIRRIPFVRGVIVLLGTMVLGMQTLLYSANVSLEQEEEKISGGLAWLLVAVSLALSTGLFFVLPLLITKLLEPYIGSPLVFHLIEGGFRLTIFILYLKLATLSPDIKRVFAYHGAEHKAINAYEDGAALEVDSTRRYSTAHTRCGTSFLFVVLVIAIIVFALIGVTSFWSMFLSRIILIPAIAALSYEAMRFGASHSQNVVIKVLLAPGLLLQSLTTREPDDRQLEVALSALKRLTEIDQLEERA